MPTISLIAAVAEDMAIGKNKELLCHMPNDLKRFKDLTVNHAVIMGRRTFESLPDGALPNRKNLVLTSIPESFYDNAFACSSIEDALNLCESQDEVFIIGGAMIYKQTIEMADKLYITEIHHKFENADTFFPVIDGKRFFGKIIRQTKNILILIPLLFTKRNNTKTTRKHLSIF